MRESVYYCPMCGSARVDISKISMEGVCRACSWKGKESDLVQHTFETSMLEGTDSVNRFVQDVRSVFAKDLSLSLGRLLRDWGFLEEKVSVMELARYVSASSQASAAAILKTREAIEEEKDEVRRAE